MKILSKAEFFKLWELGVLGNRTNLWIDPRAAYYSGSEIIGFREVGKAGGGAWERAPRDEVFKTYRKWREAGRNFRMDDGTPGDQYITLQGEICRTIRGLEGYFSSNVHLPMRSAMRAGHMRSYGGASVLVLLRTYMDPSSQDDLFDLLDLYPDATIEFTCFNRNAGVFPNRNTIFWETRDY